MTVRTLAEVVYALGAEVKLEALLHEAAQQRPSFAQMKHVVALTRSPRVARPTQWVYPASRKPASKPRMTKGR
jgi:hypothetical protein